MIKEITLSNFKCFQSQTFDLREFTLLAGLNGMGKRGRKLVKDYFQVLREGRTPEEAHARTFGKLDLDKLEQRWKTYINKL